jgi:hypothetical protein
MQTVGVAKKVCINTVSFVYLMAQQVEIHRVAPIFRFQVQAVKILRALLSEYIFHAFIHELDPAISLFLVGICQH